MTYNGLLSSLRKPAQPKAAGFDLLSYEKYIVAESGGKDSVAAFLWLLENGVDKSKIELWHHLIDGREGNAFFDWAITEDYCRKLAEAFDVPIYYSWKVGGFAGELMRENSLTQPNRYETPAGTIEQAGGKTGKLSTRRKFPQLSPDLSIRWCSAYLKIDVCKMAIRNQTRFNNSRTLVISGERGEESPARAKYAYFEPDESDNRTGKNRRHVDRLRPLLDWKEAAVWAIIKRFKVRAHPAYYLGWGRVSCLFCIFGNANQFASAKVIEPRRFQQVGDKEKLFQITIKRNESIDTLTAKGTPYAGLENAALVKLAQSEIYDQPIFMTDWVMPLGAFGESCGSI